VTIFLATLMLESLATVSVLGKIVRPFKIKNSFIVTYLLSLRLLLSF